MQNASHTIREEFYGIVAFIGVIWAVFLLTCAVPSLDSYGVVPRTCVGLVGIPAMIFLHANLHHLLANTIPLFILLALLAGSRARSWEIVIDVALLGGLLLWLVGRSATHIGASGLIFGLIAFLILSGFLEKRIVPLLMSLAVGFLYGGTLLWGILPRIGSHISWDGHLCGAIAGGIVAYALTRESKGEAENQGQSRE
ncbi:MAG: rhomboid family intramembrane serine protease [Thermoguttaceae bacterium]|jgi:membrane associated rhomboid family serine protease